MDRSGFKERVRGSLLGGAVGDALGAGVEFRSLAEIRRLCGKAGVDDYVEAYGWVGAITDDTQMTLFTAKGCIRAWVRSTERGICGVSGVIHHAYRRWLLTQGAKPAAEVRVGTDGWLFGVRALHSPRAPGNTYLSALRASDGFASPDIARNDSKVDHGGGTSASGIASQPPAAEEGSGGGSRLRLLAGQRSELADLIEDGPHRFQRQR